jgi:beta-lactamase regulating signal transducer with metallopeptidase domain
MGIGTSLFLIAAGAILRWAVSDAIQGVNLATVGLILLIVGIVGLVISLFMISRARDTVVTRDRYTEPPARY